MKYFSALTLLCALLLSSSCSQSPEKLIAAGNRYHDKKKYNEASILYQKAINKDKTNAEAYYREGLNLIDSGDALNAAKFLRRAVDLNPGNSDAATRLAEIYLAAYGTNPKRFKTLLAEIHDLDAKILQRDPNSFNGLRLQALLDLAEGNKDKALETFAKANQIKPYSPDLVTPYAETLISVQRAPEAEALVRDMLAHDPKWAGGYDILFLLYTRENQKDKAEAVLRERVQKDPSNAIGIQNLATYLLAAKRFDQAEATMKRVIEDKKTFPNGHLLLGDFYFRARKFDQALQQYQAGLNEDSKNGLQYQERMVGLYQMSGRRDEALKLAKSLVDKNSKDASAVELYASLLLQDPSKSATTKAIKELAGLIQNNPGDAMLHLHMARAYFNSNETDKALNEALEAMQLEAKSKSPRPGLIIPARLISARIYEDRGQHAKALEQTSTILSTQPENPDARLIRDRALVGTNEVNKAQADLESLTQQFPQMSDPHLLLANIYLNQKEFDKASAEFEKIWKGNPSDTRGFVGLQTVKLAEGKGDEAIKGIQMLVQENPKNLGYRYQLASFQATAGAQALKSDPARAKQLFEQAADNYKEILKTTTNSADVWLRLGVLQRQLGQNDAALASFEQAGNADPRSVAAALNQGMLLETLGKKKEAVAAYNKVLGIDPENPLALNNLAFLNADEGTNLDQAMTWAEKAKKRAPNSPDISDTLGYVYLRKNLNAEALQIFRQIVVDNPQNPTFHLHLAMALEKSGDKQAARDEAQKALKHAAEPGQQDRIRTFLNQLG